MAKKKKQNGRGEPLALDTSAPQERVDADLVEDDFERQPNDEVLAEGSGLDHEQLDEVQAAADRMGLEVAPVIQDAPSERMNPYVSEEEQGMEMRPAIVGPPPFGSPDAATSAGRLVELSTHPLRPDALPEGHPAAISADYGQGQDGTISGVQTVRQSPGAPVSASLATDVEASPAARQLAEEKGVDLSQVEGTGADGNITKGDVEDYIASLDDNQQQ